jgi:hypothetical protein
MPSGLTMIRTLGCGLLFVVLVKISHAQVSPGKTDTAKTAKPKELKEVTITTKRPLLKQMIDRTVVNISDLLSNEGANAVDALNSAPGVMIEDNGSISIKGKTGATILINDKPTHLSAADLMNYLKSLPAGTLDRIEIMSNPPARYSASGTSGLINIITKKNRQEGFNGSVTLGYGRGKELKTNNSLLLNYKLKELNFFAMAGYSRLNNYFEVVRQRNYSNPNPELQYGLRQGNYERNSKTSYHYRLGLDYDLSKNTTLGLVFNGFVSPYQERGDYTSQFKTFHPGQDSLLVSQSDLTIRSLNKTFGLSFLQKLPGKGNELSANLDYLNYQISSDQLSQTETYLPDHSLKEKYILRSQNPFETSIYSAKVDYSTKDFPLDLDAGLQSTLSNRYNQGRYFNLSDGKSTSVEALNNQFKYRENINAAYLSVHKKWTLWTLKAGIRAEQTIAAVQSPLAEALSPRDLHYLSIFPTFYAAYKLDSTTLNSLNFSIGRRISRPDYQSLNPSIFFFDRNTSNRGNPLLKPDYATNIDVNYTHLGKHVFGLSFSSVRDQLTQVYQQIGGSFALIPVNINRLRSYGLNLTSALQIADWCTSNLYGELVHTKYTGQIFQEEFLDNSGTALRLSGNVRFKLNSSLDAELSGMYRGERILGQGIYKPGGLINLAIQKKIFGKNGTLSFTARDVFHTWSLRRELSIPSVEVKFKNINDTRQFICSFSYRFGKSSGNRDRKNGIQTEAERAGAN